MRNLCCALCLFFQLLRNLRCALCLFFSACAIFVALYAFFFSACAICVCESVNLMFFLNRFACFWPKGYQLGSLGKSHQNGDYLKQAMRKIVFPQESNLQPLDYRSTALPLELEKTPSRMLNFGYLNPATCLLYDCNNKSIQRL